MELKESLGNLEIEVELLKAKIKKKNLFAIGKEGETEKPKYDDGFDSVRGLGK